jgi:hypothetical protein
MIDVVGLEAFKVVSHPLFVIKNFIISVADISFGKKIAINIVLHSVLLPVFL